MAAGRPCWPRMSAEPRKRSSRNNGVRSPGDPQAMAAAILTGRKRAGAGARARENAHQRSLLMDRMVAATEPLTPTCYRASNGVRHERHCTSTGSTTSDVRRLERCGTRPFDRAGGRTVLRNEWLRNLWDSFGQGRTPELWWCAPATGSRPGAGMLERERMTASECGESFSQRPHAKAEVVA